MSEEAHGGKFALELLDSIDSDTKVCEIVKLHSMIGGALGLFPLPAAGIVLVLGNVYTMYGRINSHLGIPFTKSVIKSIAGMVASNLAGYAGLAVGTAVAEGLKFIPLIGTMAGGMLEVCCFFAITGIQGKIYCEWLRMMYKKGALSKSGEFDENIGKETMDDIFKDKSRIEEMIRKQKEEAKKNDFKKYKSQAQDVVNQYKNSKQV